MNDREAERRGLEARLRKLESQHRAERPGPAAAVSREGGIRSSFFERLSELPASTWEGRQGAAGPTDSSPPASCSPRAYDRASLPARSQTMVLDPGVGVGAWAEHRADEPLRTNPLSVCRQSTGDPAADEADLRAWSKAMADYYAQHDSPEPPTPVPSEVLADAGIGSSLRHHDSAELATAVEHLAAVRADHDVMLVNLIAELSEREIDPPGGLRLIDWLRAHDPGLSLGTARELTLVGQALPLPRWAGLRARVSMQHVSVAAAAVIIRFHDANEPVADPEDLAAAVRDLMGQAHRCRTEELARMARALGEQIKPPPGGLDIEPDSLVDGCSVDRVRQAIGEAAALSTDTARQAARQLDFSAPSATGMVTMTGRLDPEAAAIIRAAIDPGSTPCPTRDDKGNVLERDLRPATQRRMDALIEVVSRGAAATVNIGDLMPRSSTEDDGTTPTNAAFRNGAFSNGAAQDVGRRLRPRATVVVTIGLQQLNALRATDADAIPRRAHSVAPRTGAGRAGVGLTDSGEVLTAETIRRIACDADLIPAVLGSTGELLDLGRRVRLVTPGQKRALIIRDRGCTFPGCSAPAAWTDAHHITHWAAGGPTDLGNLALLCRRHHTHVHRHELTATIDEDGVHWELPLSTTVRRLGFRGREPERPR